ncbi:MAG TPA: helix-turn-helix transcriptional regulator [Candidatus Dormibacteraeota bacterium]|nr:helix-turn-helix transcriptional regulator [Candidatus Dormibacteraeota bacterium]
MNEVRLAFGRAVRFERERRNWRQEDLARAAHIDRSYVGRIERGEVDCGLSIQEKLASAFGITLGELLRGADEEVERRRRRLQPRSHGGAGGVERDTSAHLPR